MSKKDRKRRQTTRRQKEQRQAKAAAAAEGTQDGIEESIDDDTAEDPAASIKRRAGQKREYEKRKQEKARGGQPLSPYFWGGGVVAVIAVAVLGGFLFLGGGGDDGGSNDAPSATPDPRIAGLPIDVTFTVEADDDGQATNARFTPNRITADAGQVVEIVVPNVGSVAHNLRVSGLDGEYNTRDDWLTDPVTIFAGETGRVVVKLDEPGTYIFRCDFHALQQTGVLIIR